MKIGHLARRFFRSLTARRPGTDEQEWVASLLAIGEAELFWRQPVTDQVHALRVARRIGAGEDSVPLLRAALLHDVGKRHCRLGTIGRSLATVRGTIGLARGGRARTYLEHGEIGARELEELGCETLVVAFARSHHGGPPDGVDHGDWDRLTRADDE